MEKLAGFSCSVPYERQVKSLKPTVDTMAVSRRELTRILEDLRRQTEAASRPHLPADPRRAAVVVAAARARVLQCRRPWLDPEAIRPSWNRADRLPSKTEMRGIARTAMGWIPHLDGLDHDLAPWTAGFWSGLRLSGALMVHGGHPRLRPGRPWLAADLERLPFPGRLSPAEPSGWRWLVGCAAWRLPVADTLGADVLAGLLAGAQQVERADGLWLAVPMSGSTVRLLDYWGVSRVVEEDRILVSPFYAVLLSHLMPASCAASFTVRRAGGCPLLPLATWEVVWGAGGPPHYLLPDRVGLLPFCCSHATRKRRGWTRDVLHREAVRLGVASPSQQMCKLLKRWRAREE